MPEDPADGAEPTPQTPDGGADQPPADVPAVDWESDDNPYKSRYSDLRPEFDRRQSFIDSLNNPATLGQLLQQLDDEAQAEVLRYGGWDAGIEADPDAPDLDEPMTRAEFQEFLSTQAQQQRAAQQADQALDSDAAFVADEIARLNIAEDDLDELLPLALQNRDERGNPGIEKAHQMLNGYFERRQQAYRQSKKSELVQAGQAGVEDKDLSDPRTRHDTAAAIAEAAIQAEG